jgi:hypothetical protein
MPGAGRPACVPRALDKLPAVTALQQATERGGGRAQVVEGRLFSEGLHVLGAPPGPAAMRAYLEAYFDGALPDEALDAVAADIGGGGGGGGGAHARDGGLAAVRARLERVFQQARRGGLARRACDATRQEGASGARCGGLARRACDAPRQQGGSGAHCETARRPSLKEKS